jgi:50S ribosomal protein L16 3-hydroxylase
MRAPSRAELTGDLADYLAERLDEDQRYADPDLAPARSAGEIDRPALARLQSALPFAAALDDDTLRDWFGRFITRYRNAQTPAPPARSLGAATLLKRLQDGAQLLRHPWSRMAWSRGKGDATLFANGHAWPAPAALAQQLCAQRALAPALPLAEAELALLLALVNDGHLGPRRACNCWPTLGADC